MPQEAAHILIPLIIGSLIRDFWIKTGRNKFPLHYILFLGIGAVIPDLDILLFWFLHFFGFTITQIHRTFLHSIFVPILLGAFSLAAIPVNIRQLGRHKLKLSILFLMLSIGALSHLVLDAFLEGNIMPLYPFSFLQIGINLFSYLPDALQRLAAPSLDAGLLILWLVYLEVKHKISDFI